MANASNASNLLTARLPLVLRTTLARKRVVRRSHRDAESHNAHKLYRADNHVYNITMKIIGKRNDP